MAVKKLDDIENVSVYELEKRLQRLLGIAERDKYIKEQIKDAVVRIEKRKSAADIYSAFDA